MKKMIASFVAAVFVMGLCLVGINSTALAGPAPQLSDIRVVQIYDGQNNVADVSTSYPYQVIGNKTFTGGTLYVRTKFTGYPNWGAVFYRDGRTTGQAIRCTVVKREPIYGRDRIAYGWYETVAIPFNAFSGSYPTICVTADSANGRTFSTSVSGVHIQK